MLRLRWLCATVGTTGEFRKRSSELGASSELGGWLEKGKEFCKPVAGDCQSLVTLATNGMLNQYQQINDSGALVSARVDFKLGFFSTSYLRSRYLGIWYNNIPVQTIIWVANRDRPLNDSSGGLKIGDDGNLILLDSGGIVAWSAGIQNISSKPTVALLLRLWKSCFEK
ncbi:unnamed protein product [Camellia sinensis]